MNKLLPIFLLILLTQLTVKAQGELEEEQKIFFRNERTFSFSLNSNGYGFGYREGKRLDYLNKRLIEFEFNAIKHPKEIKLSSPYLQSGSNFVFGKLNNTFSIRGGLGHQREIYKKADLGGVAIRYFYIGGPSLAFSKPIYYNVIYAVGGITYELRQETFNIDIHHPSDIYSRASFFQGFEETKITPGAYLKGGFNFEYSKKDKIIHALELGVVLEGYTRKLPIMASDDNNAFFFTLFITYRMGIVVDPFNPGSNRFKSIFFKKQK